MTREIELHGDQLVSEERVPLITVTNYLIFELFECELTEEERQTVFPNGVRSTVIESKSHPGRYRMPKDCSVTNNIIKSCLHCGLLLQKDRLKMCKQCISCPLHMQAFYCGSECQKDHWKVHKRQHQ